MPDSEPLPEEQRVAAFIPRARTRSYCDTGVVPRRPGLPPEQMAAPRPVAEPT